MPSATPYTYLQPVIDELSKTWPDNRTVQLVFHGHSVPAGYFATPFVDTLNAYPHLLHSQLKSRFPYAVINAIVTAIGGENSESGAARFHDEVLTHRPDVLMIDYGLNDRGIGLQRAEAAWRKMIEQALDRRISIILLTPTWDNTGFIDSNNSSWLQLQAHAGQIRSLAHEYEIGLVDSFEAFEAYVGGGGSASDLLSWSNHPNVDGHQLVAKLLQRWFAYC